jgi:hypothetical protein
MPFPFLISLPKITKLMKPFPRPFVLQGVLKKERYMMGEEIV